VAADQLEIIDDAQARSPDVAERDHRGVVNFQR
jgi:hypothetical protein